MQMKKYIIGNLSIDLFIIFIVLVFSKEPTVEKITLCSLVFGMGIIVSLSFVFFFYISFNFFSQLVFEVFTIFFMLGSFLGLITIIVNPVRESFLYSVLLIPMINLFFITLYIRFSVWKIDRKKDYLEKKRKKDNEKIII